jgi:hypothetical protein
MIPCSGNRPQFESFINSLLTLATDSTDRTVQRSGIGLLTRTVVIWATNPSVAALPNCGVFASSEAAANPARQVTKRSNGVDGKGANGSVGNETSGTMTEQGLLGYEQVVYDRITPALFQVIMSEGMKMKDGQSQLVSVSRSKGLGGTSPAERCNPLAVVAHTGRSRGSLVPS